VGIDWNQVRLNRLRDDQPVTLSGDEAEWLRQRREDEAARREQDAQQAGMKAAQTDFAAKAAQAEKDGDDDRAGVFAWAAGEIGKGNWPVHRLISSDPGSVRHQSTRTRLLYQGKTAQLKG
jgi:hypothetical protein